MSFPSNLSLFKIGGIINSFSPVESCNEILPCPCPIIIELPERSSEEVIIWNGFMLLGSVLHAPKIKIKVKLIEIKIIRFIQNTLCIFTTFLLRSEEHTSELQSRGHLVCRLLLENKKTTH